MDKREKDLKALRILAIYGSILSCVLVVIGLCMILFELDFNFPNKESAPWGFLLIGALGFIIAIAPYMETKSKTKQQYIEENDERNILILQKSSTIAYGLVVGLSTCALLFLTMLGYMNKVSFFILISIILLSEFVQILYKRHLEKTL